MDFFGFGSAADLSTPVGHLIKSATDSLLLGADWSKNLEICDLISNSREGPEQALKAISRRIQDNDHNTVYLSLILLETCFKNCGQTFIAHVDKAIMNDVVNVAKGNRGDKNAQEALRLIQQWGRTYENAKHTFPIFFDTFIGLKSKGFPFPREEPAFDPSSRSRGSSSDNERQSGSKLAASFGASAQQHQQQERNSFNQHDPEMESNNRDESGRLQRDLGVVMEKVRLCREMLLVSPGIEEDEILADVVGFLEACRDRMAEVIEAGTQGLLAEEMFADCLKVNDAVLRTLDAERTGSYIAVDEEDSKKQRGEETKGEDSTGGVDLLDLNIGGSSSSSSSSSSNQQPPSSSLLSAAEDDVFGSLDGKAAVRANNGKKTVPKSAVIKASTILQPTATATTVTPAADPFAFDPFTAPPQPPVVAAAAASFDPFALAPPPVVPLATPTPFDNLVPQQPVVPAPAPAAGAMTDADFDAFFNDLEKPKTTSG